MIRRYCRVFVEGERVRRSFDKVATTAGESPQCTVHTCMQTHTHMHIRMHMHTHAHTHAHLYVNIHTPAQTHAHFFWSHTHYLTMYVCLSVLPFCPALLSCPSVLPFCPALLSCQLTVSCLMNLPAIDHKPSTQPS